MKKQKIFKAIFIDDEPLVLEGLKVMIDWEANGFEVAGTFDIVEEALEFIEHTQPDFVITDINMPIINGLELIRRLKAMKPELAVCILSGYRDFNYAREAMMLEVSNYLVKPVFDDDLLPIVSEVYGQLSERWLQEKAMSIGISELILGLLTRQYTKDDSIVLEAAKMQFGGDSIFSQWRCLVLGNYTQEVCELQKVIVNQEIRDRISEGIIDSFAFSYSIDGACVIVLNMIVLEGLYKAIVEALSEESETSWVLEGIDVDRIEGIYKSYESCLEAKFFVHPYILPKEEQEYLSTDEVFVKLTDAIKGIDKEAIDTSIKAMVIAYANSDMSQRDIQSDFVIRRSKYYAEIGLFLKDLQKEEVIQRPIEQNQLVDFGSLVECVQMDVGSLIHVTSEVKKSTNDDLVQEVEAYIKAHMSESISLKSIADKFFMHPNYLGQKLKKQWGMSYNEYLNRQRINQSFALLTTTQNSVHNIAEAVGYKNYTAFLDYFKKYVGMTPVEYRKSMKNG